MQRPSRASGKLEEEETGLFLATAPATWDYPAPLTRGPVCSQLPPSLPALGPVLYSSTTTSTICTLCRLSTCRTHCLTPTRRARTSPRLISIYLRYRRPRRLLPRHPATGEAQFNQSPSQESSQVGSRYSSKSTAWGLKVFKESRGGQKSHMHGVLTYTTQVSFLFVFDR